MRADASEATIPGGRGLATALAPALVETTGNRLHDLAWFKADWQRGGAATATARWTCDDGVDVKVVLKFPVVRRELIWTQRLQPAADDDDAPVVPRLFAAGEAVAGYDLRWLIMERFPYGPLGRRWNDGHVPRVAEAAARFHARAAAFETDEPPRREPWPDMLREALEAVRRNRLAESNRWTTAIKALLQRLDPIVAEWRARDTSAWLHGDLHLANAMCREAFDQGPVALIDLAEVHAGHWIEDAVYLERQLWAVPEHLRASRPVRAIAKARKALGLPVERGYPRLAMIRRVLLAATAPDFLKSEGHPRHLEACLEWLERGLAELK